MATFFLQKVKDIILLMTMKWALRCKSMHNYYWNNYLQVYIILINNCNLIFSCKMLIWVLIQDSQLLVITAGGYMDPNLHHNLRDFPTVIIRFDLMNKNIYIYYVISSMRMKICISSDCAFPCHIKKKKN